MNHPPIPPNCPAFGINPEPWFDLSEYALYTRNDEGDNCDGPFIHEPGDCRKLIAAVARCAWMDEAEKHQADAELPLVEYSKAENFGKARPYFAALANAEAWRAWGAREE